MKTHTIGCFIPPGLGQRLPHLCSDCIVKNQVLGAAGSARVCKASVPPWCRVSHPLPTYFYFMAPQFYIQQSCVLSPRGSTSELHKAGPRAFADQQNCMSGYRDHSHCSQELLRNIELPRSWSSMLFATKMSSFLIPATENVRPCTPVSRAAPTTHTNPQRGQIRDSVLAFVWMRLGSQLEPGCLVAHGAMVLPLPMLPEALPCTWLLSER